MSRKAVRTYEGRPLVRDDDEVVDQGLGFDLDTLVSRRRVLLTALGVGASLGLAACGGKSASSGGSASGLAEIPDETAGPYPGDGSNGPDILEQSGIVRSDIRSSIGGADGTAGGVPMTLELTCRDLADNGAPYEGVAVYVWHCDRDGGYSMYSEGLEDENFLRGVQVADRDGRVSFTSIFPACYPGRWPHVHFEVYPGRADISDLSSVIATSQIALPKETCDQVYAQRGYEASVANLSQLSLETDGVFSDDGGESQLAAVTGDVSRGYKVSLDVGIDPSTAPTGGGFGGDGAPGPPAGGEPGGDGAPVPPSGAPGDGAPPAGGTPPPGLPSA